MAADTKRTDLERLFSTFGDTDLNAQLQHWQWFSCLNRHTELSQTPKVSEVCHTC